MYCKKHRLKIDKILDKNNNKLIIIFYGLVNKNGR